MLPIRTCNAKRSRMLVAGLMAGSGGSWRFIVFEVAGSWLLVAARGGSWRLVAARRCSVDAGSQMLGSRMLVARSGSWPLMASSAAKLVRQGRQQGRPAQSVHK